MLKKKIRMKPFLFIAALLYIFVCILVMVNILESSVDEYEMESKKICKSILRVYEKSMKTFEISVSNSRIDIKIIFDENNNKVFTTDQMNIAYHVYVDMISLLHESEHQYVEKNTDFLCVKAVRGKNHDRKDIVDIRYDTGEDVVYHKSMYAISTCKWNDLSIFTEMNQIYYCGEVGELTVFDKYRNLENLILSNPRSYTKENQKKITEQLKKMLPECKVEWEGGSKEDFE